MTVLATLAVVAVLALAGLGWGLVRLADWFAAR